MNDDFDLDARLRVGARAFPPAPTPDSTRLRDVLTTSRRRSRRAQGSVLACGTVAVAGAAGLALREPAEPELVAAAPSVPESQGTTAVPAFAVPDAVSEVCDFPREYTVDGDLAATPEGIPIYVIYGSGWGLDQGLPGTAVILDGIDLYPTYGARGGGTDGPDEGIDLLVVPLLDGEHQITVSVGGNEHTLTFVADTDLRIVPPSAPGPPDIGVARLSVLCGGNQEGTVEATTTLPGPATTVPTGQLAPTEGPSAPTTSTVPQPPPLMTTTTPLSVPPTTVP